MPMTWHFIRDGGYFAVEMTGTVTVEEVYRTVDELRCCGNFPSDAPALWDTRQLDFEAIDRRFLNQMMEIRTLYPERQESVAAVVVGDDLGFGMARMYQGLAAELPDRLRIFRDYTEAERWLTSLCDDEPRKA